ncbi:MAG: molybdenum cofactor biosynthesis protein MoaE, partial [Deltaproteobacteria bacterium]
MYRITTEPIDLNELYAAVSDPQAGGIAIFLGVVRDRNIDREVRFLEYEAYPEMARKKLAEIGESAKKRWP